MKEAVNCQKLLEQGFAKVLVIAFAEALAEEREEGYAAAYLENFAQGFVEGLVGASGRSSAHSAVAGNRAVWQALGPGPAGLGPRHRHRRVGGLAAAGRRSWQLDRTAG